MASIVRGKCNLCGQCCGLGMGCPAFPRGFFTLVRQYQESPDADVSVLPPAQVEMFNMVKDAINKQKVKRIGGRNFKLMLLLDEEYGVRQGLVKSPDEPYCPFLDAEGKPDPNAPDGVAHHCLIYGKTKWQVEMCQNAPPWAKVGQVIDGREELQAKRFLKDCWKCGYYLESVS